jgi:hypothetical protein
MADVRSTSWMRCGQGDATNDDVLTVHCTGEGLSVQIADKGHRGRQHVITVPYELLDGIAEQRHGIKKLHQHLIILRRLLKDIGRISEGASYTIEPEETEEAA